MALPRPGDRGGSTVASAVTASLVVLALAGCSGAGPTGDSANTGGNTSASGSASSGAAATTPAVPKYEDLFPSMVAAVAAMKTARVKGQITEGGLPITADIRGTLSDTEVFGQVTDKAGPLTVLRVKGKTYVRATREYWNKQIGRRAARAIATNWVPLPDKTPLGAVTVGALIRQTLDFTPDDSNLRDSTVTKGVLGKVPVYIITSPDKLRTLYVFAAGRPLPLRYVVRAPAGGAPASGASGPTASSFPAQPGASPSAAPSPTDSSSGAPVSPSPAAPGQPSGPAPGATGIVTDIIVTSWNKVPPVQAPSPESVVSS